MIYWEGLYVIAGVVTTPPAMDTSMTNVLIAERPIKSKIHPSKRT
jgi:hypothetical protein